jgi:sugar (pentulose or hexulose) kinase
LNLAPGTPVVYGGGDNQMSLLGNGWSPGSPALIIGTGA